MADQNEKAKNSDEEILRVGKERFLLCEEAYAKPRAVGLEDAKFRAGDQWPSDVKNARDMQKRPCLTINRMTQFIRQITNDQRQNRPSVKVNPVDDKADIETAKIYQGLVRHIEYDSHADVAIDTAFEGAVTSGFGFFRIITEYVGHDSFDQEIKIKSIPDNFSVYLDPFAKEPDGSDAEYGFVFEDVNIDDYKAKHPRSELSNSGDWDSHNSAHPSWFSGKSCRIAEYFYKEYAEVELVLFSDGSVFKSTEIPKDLPAGISEVRRRTASIPSIKWCKINGVEVLEKTEWLGKWIPIIPVYGDTLIVNGEKIFEGVVRHAKDSQRMLNYWASTETETIALAPKAPYVIAEGQIPEKYENMWATANSANHSHLVYNPISSGGHLVGPPQRNVYEPAVGAITNARAQASEDLKATTGIYDAALGNRSNENSGIAIQRRNAQSQTSNFHFIDNLTRSIRHAGRIIVDLIPHVYDTERTARIIGEDGQQEIIQINKEFERNGQQQFFKLGVGKYDVTVETGPSFATKRQEAAASLMDFAKAIPQQAALISDLIAKNMDWPGASEIAERIKKTLPPGIADDKNQPQQQIPPEAQQQLQQTNQMVEQLTAKLNEANEQIKTKVMDLESKERIEFAKMEVDLQKEMMKAAPNQAIQVLLDQVAQISARLEIVGMNHPIDQESNLQNINESVPFGNAPQDNQLTGELPPGQSQE